MAVHPATDRDAPERIALQGVVVNAGLALAKLVAGLFGQSFALVADAVESLVDIAGSAVIWGAFRYGGRPPDDDHPFGHGKMEALAALAVAMLIIVAGLGIGVESVRQLLTPQEPPRAYTLVVLLLVVVVKEIMYRRARVAARRADSNAGHADAGHHRADAITSLLAFVGIGVSLVGGPSWAAADDCAALAASLVITINGVVLSRRPIAELTDLHAPEVAQLACDEAMAVHGILAIERCEARQSGRGYRVVMHAEVDQRMTVADSHRLTGIVKQRVRDRSPEIDSVLIHIEPHEPGDG